MLMGFGNNTKGYKLFNPWTKKIMTSKDVVVDEFVQGL
jgi:hypothetical protein